MTWTLRLGSAIVLGTVLAPSGFGEALAPCEPVHGCYIGAYIEMDPVAKDDIPTFETLTSKKHASYFRYVGYGQPFPFQWANSLKAAGATPHIAWEPNDGLEAVRDDTYLQGWAQACAHFGEPIFLRFASEMNGDWEAYSGDPDLYIEKWRLVYNALHSVAPNVVMIWCPFATPKSTIPLYYPGDDYVDWVGVNIYSVVFHQGDVNKRAVTNAVQHLEFIYNLYAERKPIAVCEYAATHFCKAAEGETVDFAIREMKRVYESIETRFPRVRMINWFSVDAANEGLAHNDYSLTSNQRVLDTYRTLISSPHFLSQVVSGPGGIAGVGSVTLPGAAAPPGASAGPRPGAASPGDGTVILPGAARPAATAVVFQPPSTGVPLALTEHASPPANGIAIVVKGGQPAALEGRVRIEAVLGSALRPARVLLELDGRTRAASNMPPYFFPWNASNASPGEHRIRAIAKNDVGGIIAETQAAVVVAEAP